MSRPTSRETPSPPASSRDQSTKPLYTWSFGVGLPCSTPLGPVFGQPSTYVASAENSKEARLRMGAHAARSAGAGGDGTPSTPFGCSAVDTS